MKYHKIEGNIEGVPFILIPMSDLVNWRGFYLLDNESRYPDLKFGDQGFKIYDGDDFENPKTDWGFVICKMLKSQESPLLIEVRDFEVLLIDPTTYTAWEGYQIAVAQYKETYYFVFHLEKDFEIDERSIENIVTDMSLISSLKWLITDNKIKLLHTTEHGLDRNNQIFADIDIIPGTYQVDLFLQKSDYPSYAIYRMEQTTIK